jgi:DNA-binding response OmpR family regulator
MTKQRLLIVEDDTNLGQILKEYLEIKGYDAVLNRDGVEGLATFKNELFDCCILDVMMPKKDGFTLAKEIKRYSPNTPIIFLTAKSLKSDTITGLTIGADDYMTKPFSMEELLLRLKAILKRAHPNDHQSTTYNLGDFTYDSNQYQLHYLETSQKLTSKEGKLLELFCQNINSTVDRSLALKLIWGDDTYFNARSMDVYITKLRKLLKPDNSLQIITIHRQGFKLVKIR